MVVIQKRRVSVDLILTNAERQVEQAHTNIQTEEEKDIGHLAEEDDVSYMLFHCY